MTRRRIRFEGGPLSGSEREVDAFSVQWNIYGGSIQPYLIGRYLPIDTRLITQDDGRWDDILVAYGWESTEELSRSARTRLDDWLEDVDELLTDPYNWSPDNVDEPRPW